VTCHDAREWLSALVDDAVDPSRRAELEAHLAGCPECRLELDGLRATVGLLRRVEAPRVPVGFVDRVMERARPTPWYRRLAAWLFLPLAVKLPVQGVAIVVIAGLAIFLFERTPDVREAAHMAPPAAQAPAPSEPAPVTSEPAPVTSPSSAPPRQARDRQSQPVEPAPARRAGPEVATEQESRKAVPSLASPAPPPPPGAVAATPPPASTDSAVRSEKPLVREAPAAAASGASAAIALGGRLIVNDREAAIAALSDLLARLGGRELRRRADGAEAVVDVQISRARYGELIRGLQELGAWTPELWPDGPPETASQMVMSIRIQ
jgi:anti-sigma factor RsiW